MMNEIKIVKDARRVKYSWLPLIVGLSFAILVIVLCQRLMVQERAHLQETVANEAQHVADLIKGNLEKRVPALERIARRWEVRGGTPRKEWEADVANYILHNPDFQALEWVDPSFHVRWIWPIEGNKKAQDLDLGSEPNRLAALIKAKDLRAVIFTPPLDLVQGGTGFLVYVPIVVKDTFQGFILAVVRYQRWLDMLLAPVEMKSFIINIFSSGQEVYALPHSTSQDNRKRVTTQEAAISLYGLDWRVRVSPTPELIARSATWVPWISLVGGLVMAALTGFLVRISQIATHQTKRITAINRTLEQEVAERLKAEESLRITQFTVDRSGDSVFWIAPDARFLYVNNTACQSLGYTRDELLKMAVYDMNPDWSRERWPEFWQTLKEQDIVQLQTRHQRKNGSVFPVEMTTNFLEFEGKAYVCAVVRNITERKHAEEGLQRHAQQQAVIADLGQKALTGEPLPRFMDQVVGVVAQTLRTEYCKVLELAPDGTSCVLLAGVGWKKGLVGRATVDASLESQAGYTLASLNPVIVHDLRVERRFNGSHLLQEHGIVSGMSVMIAGTKGPYGVLGVYATKCVEYSDDDVVFLQSVANLLASTIALKQAEANQVRLHQELEKKNQELEQFNFTISHDLKSPLITIQGFLGLVEQDIQAGHTERLVADCQRIKDATTKMKQLLDELLQLSRIGRIVNPSEEVAMSEVIREALERVAGPLHTKGIQVDIAPEWPGVFGDRIRLIEVVQNLLDNAIKFMGDQPEPRIEAGTRQEGQSLVMFIRDNGIGIDPDYHEKVFGLFERLETQMEGTGIGLALVKRIIEVQGGRIWVESDGQGSTFCFVLPHEGIENS